MYGNKELIKKKLSKFTSDFGFEDVDAVSVIDFPAKTKIFYYNEEGDLCKTYPTLESMEDLFHLFKVYSNLPCRLIITCEDFNIMFDSNALSERRPIEDA